MDYEDNDVLGEIYVNPNNKMRAAYTLYAVGSSDIYTEIEVSVGEESTKETELSVRAIDKHELDAEIDVKYGGLSDVLAEIQPVGHMNIPTEIEVRSGNRMWALYEVQEPPKLTTSFEPYKDSLTRSKPEFEAINYGGHNSLTVGNTNEETYHSFIQFGLHDWNPQFKIIESKVRLHYSGLIPQGAKFELYTVDEIWQEYGITHLNKPNPVRLIIDDYTNYPSERYVEFDITETVLNWIEREEENYGIMIKLADDSIDTHVTFRSRESNRPPELVVTYYDGRVYSAGRSNTLAEIFVWRVGQSEVLAEIDVHSVIGNSDVPTELYVHRYEVPVPHDIDAEITVTREKIDTELTVSIQDNSDVLAEVSARVEAAPSRRDSEITISKPFQLAEIFVAYDSIIDTELTVQRHEDSDVLTEITVTREYIDSEIYVKYTDYIDTEIEVQRHEDSSIDTEITVTREYIFTEIVPRAIGVSELDTEITARSDVQESVILTEITVTREEVLTEITSRQVENNDVDTEIYARAVENSDVLTEITTTREYVDVEITVTHYNDTEAEIYVKYRDYVESEITVTVFNDIPVEIDVVPLSKVEAEITITRPNVPAEIVVPFWDDSDVLTEIQPRILRASDIETVISVTGSVVGAYAFII